MIEVTVKTLFIILVMMAGLLPVVTWIERKQSALMQDRIGANRADIAGITILGLFHPIADVIKLMTKEDMVPTGANRVLHLLAPAIALVGAIVTLAVIPFGGVYTWGDYRLSLVPADVDWGLLYLFAVGSIATYGAVLAGWSSNNNWSLLGGLRASAQMISFEVTMGLSVVGIFMIYETLKLPEMAIAQDQTFRLLGFLEHFGWVESIGVLGWLALPQWGIFLQPLAFFMFLTCIMAENKRPPFDRPEGESELIAGYHLEYSGMRFGLFFTAEFLEVPIIGAVVTTLFLGGWAVPYLPQETIIGGLGSLIGTDFATILCMVIHFATFMLKVVVMIFVQMTIRWSLPRFRYDQIMDLCWKIILPLSVANIFVTGLVILLIGEVS